MTSKGRWIGILLAGVSVPAFAQTESVPAITASAEVDQVDVNYGEILVTAQRREQSLSDVPLSISAFSGDDLTSKGIESVADLARIVPGFSFTQSDSNVPIYTLRGVGYNETALAASPAVAIYVDEVALPYPAMTAGANLDLQRVEVLKGPQGTLYGLNSTGGAINYIANRPTTDFSAGLDVGYGRFNVIDVDGFVSGPLSDAVRARLAFSSNTADAWQISQTRPDDRLGKVNRQAARLLVDIDASDSLTFTINVNGWQDKGDTQAPQLIAVRPSTPARALPEVLNAPLAPARNRVADWDAGRDFSRDDSFYQLAFRGDLELGADATLTSITSYSRYDTDTPVERDGMASQNLLYNLSGFVSSFAQELRLTGSFGDTADYVVGGNYSRDRSYDLIEFEARTSSNSQNNFGFPLFFLNTYSRQRSENWAVFGSVDWKLSSDLVLTTAARYTSTDRDFEGCTYDPGDGNPAAGFVGISAFFRAQQGLAPLPAGTFQPGECITLDANFAPALTSLNLKEDNISWRGALSWHATDALMLYASASRGFKSGNIPTVSASSIVQYQPVTQEQLTAYEGGFKYQSADRLFDASGAVYYYDYNDKQLKGRRIDAIFGTLQALTNIPESHVFGVEVNATIRPAQGLAATLSGAYTKTEIDRYTGFTPFAQLIDFKGTQFPFSPKWQLNADLSYEWDVGNARASLGGAASYRSKTIAATGNAPLFDIDSYTLVDLRARVEWPDSGWSVAAYAKNIFGAYYWNNVFKGNDTVTRYAGMPTTYGMSIGYRF